MLEPEPTFSPSYFYSQALELRERWSLLSFWEKENIVPLSLKALGYVYARVEIADERERSRVDTLWQSTVAEIQRRWELMLTHPGRKNEER